MSAAAALRFRSGQGFRCTPQAYAEPAHFCGVVHFGENGACVLSVSILFSSGENGTFLLCFASVPPKPCAAQRRRASLVLECRISLFTGNAAVRRCPFGRKRVGAKISPRTACAAMRRKPSGGIMRVKNEFIIERK